MTVGKSSAATPLAVDVAWRFLRESSGEKNRHPCRSARESDFKAVTSLPQQCLKAMVGIVFGIGEVRPKRINIIVDPLEILIELADMGVELVNQQHDVRVADSSTVNFR